jgi:hypothetical protein
VAALGQSLDEEEPLDEHVAQRRQRLGRGGARRMAAEMGRQRKAVAKAATKARRPRKRRKAK